MKIMTVEILPHVTKKFRGKQICFVPSQVKGEKFYVLSVIIKDEEGHYPLPWQIAWGTKEDMEANAATLNDELKLTEDQVTAFLVSSMKSTRRR